ncbi:hypothetical protein G7Z17_g9860 [Cylindrodendrum hubeiense]|uniref:Sphingolipid long chain base-responsive protein LSP1 n=1 Tax=Cylindrodendrum hubeiense TaxID=595255 RepID=A0A9P5H462_9HYPO|nr:hypothetical protein G7Z17_g9860 [Cylindrodendrum hubeiense]
MCFRAEPKTKYYYHEEVIPARRYHHHHGHNHHHHHSPHASYTSVTRRSYSSQSPRASYPLVLRAHREDWATHGTTRSFVIPPDDLVVLKPQRQKPVATSSGGTAGSRISKANLYDITVHSVTIIAVPPSPKIVRVVYDTGSREDEIVHSNLTSFIDSSFEIPVPLRTHPPNAVMSRSSFDGSVQHLIPLCRPDSGLTMSSYRNRALSIRSNKTNKASGSAASNTKRGFSFSSLRGTVQPELSRKLFRLIKSENNLIGAHETAGRERVAIATQLSEWGEQTGDDSISDISDKVGVVLSEMGEQEDTYAHALDDSRAILKTIRNTEKSVQPSRDGKSKIADEIQRIKMKEPESAKLVVLEQELVRAEAENLVAEAQLSNITRQKLKEAYAAEFAATIERAEKQIILAKHGRRLLDLLDDTPVVPGDSRPVYEHSSQARQILNDCEDDLKEWQPETDAYKTPDESRSPSLKGKGKETSGVDETVPVPVQTEANPESAV